MGNEVRTYKNLTELLLNLIRWKPGMYLGKNHISYLPNFILGYELCSRLAHNEDDFYFGEDGFFSWYSAFYNNKQPNSWTCLFLDEVGEDQEAALSLYFTRLEEYYNWYSQKIQP